MNKWRDTSLLSVGLVVGIIATLLFWVSAGLPTSFADARHAPEGQAEGFWKEVGDPHPNGLNCYIWVNRGDHDVSLIWCDDEKIKKDKHEDDD